MGRRKKSSKLIPFAIIGVASVVVVMGMFYVAGQQQQSSRPAPAPETSNLSTSSDNGTFGEVGDTEQRQMDSFEDESEQRLAELREQEAELNTIYEGTEETVYQGEEGDPALLEGESGQFSDFDAAPAPAPEADPAPEPQPGSAVSEDPAPDEALTQSLMEEAPAPTVPGVAEPRIAALEDRIDALGAELQEVASSQSSDDMLTETMLAPLREDVEMLDRRVANLAERIENLGDASDQVDGERLASLAQRFEAFSGDMTSRLEGLDERLAEAADKSASSPSPTPAAAPRRPAVSGLYKLLAIEGNVAVLEGQNTGRTYRIAEGGDLAYGGRLLDLNGDQAVLAWPHRSVELSIYGE